MGKTIIREQLSASEIDVLTAIDYVEKMGVSFVIDSSHAVLNAAYHPAFKRLDLMTGADWEARFGQKPGTFEKIVCYDKRGDDESGLRSIDNALLHDDGWNDWRGFAAYFINEKYRESVIDASGNVVKEPYGPKYYIYTSGNNVDKKIVCAASGKQIEFKSAATLAKWQEVTVRRRRLEKSAAEKMARSRLEKYVAGKIEALTEYGLRYPCVRAAVGKRVKEWGDRLK